MPKRNLRTIEDYKYGSVIEKYTPEPTEPEFSMAKVQVQLMIDAKVSVKGHVTGNSYVFNGAGSVVDVDETDVENLLEKRQGGRQCCGGTGFGNQMFSLAEVN